MAACRKALLSGSVVVLLVLLAGSAYHVAAESPIGERLARTDEHLVALERRVTALESSMEWQQRTQLGALAGIIALLVDALLRARARRDE